MKRFIVIDVGCFECGVSTLFVNSFDTLEEAQALTDPNNGWRDGGQSDFMVFDSNNPGSGAL